MKALRYIVMWNGCGYAVHDTEVDWDVSVHRTSEEAERAAKVLNERAAG